MSIWSCLGERGKVSLKTGDEPRVVTVNEMQQ